MVAFEIDVSFQVMTAVLVGIGSITVQKAIKVLVTCPLVLTDPTV